MALVKKFERALSVKGNAVVEALEGKVSPLVVKLMKYVGNKIVKNFEYFT
ncbi:hypothetical protein HanPI659440_Chr06g0222431 [Helianthus annuus]|nr:hypothetical protein HanPI659440_Chr06g0222431 [Helianthus annuus]